MKTYRKVLTTSTIIITLAASGVLVPKANADGWGGLVALMAAGIVSIPAVVCGGVGEIESRAINKTHGMAKDEASVKSEAAVLALAHGSLSAVALAKTRMFQGMSNSAYALGGAACGAAFAVGYNHGRDALTSQSEDVLKKMKEIETKQKELEQLKRDVKKIT